MQPLRDITNDYKKLPNGKRQLLTPYTSAPPILKKLKKTIEPFKLNPMLFKSESEL